MKDESAMAGSSPCICAVNASRDALRLTRWGEHSREQGSARQEPRTHAGNSSFILHPSSFILGAAVLLLSALSAGAGQVPSLSQDMIPPDMPPEVRKLVLQLYSDNIPDILAAERALGEMGPAAVFAAPFLTSMLPGHFSVEEANHAAQALVRIGKGAFDAVAVAASPTAGEARRRAVLVLARIDGLRAVPVILDVFAAGQGHDAEWVALRRIGEPAQTEVLKAAESPDATLRRAAVAALPAFSSARIGCRGIDGYGDGEQPWHGTQAAVNLLLRAAGDSDAYIRLTALRSLDMVASCSDKKMPLGETLRAALHDAEPTVRREAIGLALRTDELDKVKFEVLTPLLGDPVPQVRSEAVSAIGALSVEKARVLPLLVDLLKDDQPLIRQRAAVALGDLGAPEGEGPLVAALRDEARPVQVAAAAALAKAAGKTGVEALIERAQAAPDPSVRLEALRSLASLYRGYCSRVPKSNGPRQPEAPFRPEDAEQAERAYLALAEALADPMTDLHFVAIEALMCTPRGARKDLIPLLLLALHSPDNMAGTNVVRHFLPASGIRDDRLLEAVQQRVLHAMKEGGEYEYSLGLLARWGDPRSLPVFRTVLLRGVVKSDSATSALIRAGGAELEFVLKSLGNPKAGVREQVAFALSHHLDDPGVRDGVRAAFNSADPLVRDGARRLLGRVPATARTFEPFDERLRAAIWGGRESWRSVLSRNPAAPRAEAAAKLLGDGESVIRAAAAEILGTLGDRSAVPRLLSALRDTSPVVRTQVLDALGTLGDGQSAPEVVKLLSDPDEAVREAAARALGRLAVPATLAALIQALHSPDWHLRCAAAQGLSAFADPRAAEAMGDAAVRDPHACVRQTAAAALGRKVDLSRVPALIGALGDEHWFVRCAAHESLAAITRQKLAAEPEAWRTWWDGARNGSPAPERKN